jgi:hypothetical protein
MPCLVETEKYLKKLTESRRFLKDFKQQEHADMDSPYIVLFCHVLINKFHKNNLHIVCFGNINTINFILIQGKQG